MKLSVYVFGSNPLPTFMALCYDMGLVEVPKDHKKPDRLLFVISKDTIEYAQNCIDLLSEKGVKIKQLTDKCKLKNVYKSVEVYKEISKKLATYIETDTIYLNNTGGTKVMSVNSTMAIVDYATSTKDIEVIEIDIDPEVKVIRTHCLCPNRSNTDTVIPNDGSDYDLLFKGLITISDLAGLYSLTVEDKQSKELNYTMETQQRTLDFGRTILERINSYNEFMIWYFCTKNIRKMNSKFINNPAFLWELSDKNATFTIDDEKKEHIKNVNDYFRKRNLEKIPKYVSNYYDSNCINKPSIITVLKDNGFLQSDLVINEDFLNYITGTWLEDYVYALIQQILSDKHDHNIPEGLYEVAHSFKAKPKDGIKGTDYEIDIVFRKGVTVTFISCTTDESEEKITKEKINQVLQNAETLGLRTKTMMITFQPENKKEKFEQRFGSFSVQKYKDLNIVHFLRDNNYQQNVNNNEIELKKLLEEKLSI